MTRPLGAALSNGVLGLTGLGLGAFFLKRCADVLNGPGDDNPIAMLFLFAAGLACLPARGLVRLARNSPLRGWSSIA